MQLSNSIAYMSVAELASHIRNRNLSPVEILKFFIQRIEERDRSLNSFVYLGFDDALKSAKEAENAVMKNEKLGSLHGVPTALKDLFGDYPGWVNTFGGIKAFKNYFSDSYCVYADRMERSGAVILGKTNSPIIGFRGTCDNYLFGPTSNPFDITKNSGGSSGGSAAAVADGLVPIAQGTDGGGSIRIPASWCGLYGYKASFGTIPAINRPNAFGNAIPFASDGALTRTVEDAAIGLNVLAGYDSRDPLSLKQSYDYTKALNGSVKGWKIAYSPDFDIFPVDEEVRKSVEAAVQELEEAGAHIERVKLGFNHSQKELSDVWCKLITLGSVEFIEDFKSRGVDLLGDHREDFPPELLEWLKKDYKMTYLELMKDQIIRTDVFEKIQGIFENYDLLITPTLASLPVDNENDGNTVGPNKINNVVVDPLIGWCLTYLINFTGHPAASIPTGLSKNNLPIGMQIIGQRYADSDVLTASAVFERIKPWKHIYQYCENRSLNSIEG